MRTRTAAFVAACALLSACSAGSDEGAAAPEEEVATEETVEEEAEEEVEAPVEPVAIEFGPPSGVVIASAAPYTSVPLALGYFTDEGLDVTINEAFSGSVAAIQAVDAGQLDIGMGATSSLIAAVANGAELTGFYTQITGNNQLPAVAADSDIQGPLDLVGKTVGVSSLQSASVGLIKAMVLQEGGDPESIDFVAAGSGLEALNFLQAGQIDVIGMWDARYAEIQALGQPLRLIGNDYFAGLGFHMSLIAKDEVFAAQQDVMARFARALSRAMVFSQENPEAAVRIHWEVYPQSKPAGVSDEEALAQAVRVLTARNDFTRPAEGLWGNTTAEQVQQQLDLQADLNGLTGVEVDDVWSGAVIDAANDFDAAAVVAEAQAYTP